MWRAWYEAEPRGEERGDYQAGLVAQQVFLGARVLKDGAKPPKAKTFAALLEKEWEELTPKEKRLRRKAQKEYDRREERKKTRRWLEAGAAQVEAKRRQKAESNGRQ